MPIIFSYIIFIKESIIWAYGIIFNPINFTLILLKVSI